MSNRQPISELTEIKWLGHPQAQNYPAALSYLCLIFDETTARKLVYRLRRAEIVTFKAKDIFRASGHTLLGVSNSHVKKDKKKIKKGTALSPLLLVRSTRDNK